jgi:hypothetical protein
MGGLFIRYMMHPAIGVRLGMNYGILYATDAWNKDKAIAAPNIQDDYYQRYTRNQNIKDYVWEGNLMIEIDPLRAAGNTRRARKIGQPYLLGGIAAFHYKPYSTYTNHVTGSSSWQNIADLHLEGDGFTKDQSGNPWTGKAFPAAIQYWQMAIPLGVGYRWEIGEHLGLCVEYVWRMTFTDYLDGVSGAYIDPALFATNLPANKATIAQDMYDRTWVLTNNHRPVGQLRGNSSNNDSYSTVSISFFYKIKSKSNPWWGQYRID